MFEIPISGALHGLLGHKFGSSDLVIVYSARLDEAGTDGRSPYTVLAGAVATAGQWDKLEERWDALLMRSKVDAFHYKEFNEPAPPFDRWSGFKRKRFIDSQEKAIEKNTLFRVSIGVENAVHKSIKERMRGIKGFRADSDYALCLRYLMFHTSDQLGACLSSRWHFRSESDSVLLHEQAFPPLEDRPGAASAAERAGLRAEGPSVAFHRGAGPGEPGPG